MQHYPSGQVWGFLKCLSCLQIFHIQEEQHQKQEWPSFITECVQWEINQISRILEIYYSCILAKHNPKCSKNTYLNILLAAMLSGKISGRFNSLGFFEKHKERQRQNLGQILHNSQIGRRKSTEKQTFTVIHILTRSFSFSLSQGTAHMQQKWLCSLLNPRYVPCRMDLKYEDNALLSILFRISFNLPPPQYPRYRVDLGALPDPNINYYSTSFWSGSWKGILDTAQPCFSQGSQSLEDPFSSASERCLWEAAGIEYMSGVRGGKGEQLLFCLQKDLIFKNKWWFFSPTPLSSPQQFYSEKEGNIVRSGNSSLL